VEKVGSSLGDYRLEAGRWSEGRPVYKKVDGDTERVLFVREGTCNWVISESTSSAASSIISGRATNSPASSDAGPSHRGRVTRWQYSRRGFVQSPCNGCWEEGDISVTCLDQ